jgi:hypothetical protein
VINRYFDSTFPGRASSVACSHVQVVWAQACREVEAAKVQVTVKMLVTKETVETSTPNKGLGRQWRAVMDRVQHAVEDWRRIGSGYNQHPPGRRGKAESPVVC